VGRPRAHSGEAVLGLEEDADSGRQEARHLRGQADAQVHEAPMGNLPGHAPGDDLLGIASHGRLSSRKCTRMPGVRTASGGMAPTGTISSASTITVAAAVAMTGLKFWAVNS